MTEDTNGPIFEDKVTEPAEIDKAMRRYTDAAHRVQTAISFNPAKQDQAPKHLRVGIDLGKAEAEGLATLLIEKGVITKIEYLKAVAGGVEREANRQEAELSRLLGANIKTT